MKRQLMMGTGIFSGIFIILLGIVLSGCGGGGGGPSGPTPTPSGPTPTPLDVVEITANITTPTTWVGGKVYLIRKYDFYVMSTLTINAGAVVKFHPTDGPYLLLDTGGRILANGTGTNKIVFTSYLDDAHGGDTNGNGSATSPDAGDWGYIGTNNATSASTFNYCEFYYGGGVSYDCTLQIYGTSDTITNCTFAHNIGTDCGVLDADDASAGTIIQNNTFYDNEKPLAIDTKYNIDDSNTFHNPLNSAQKNTYNGIFLWSPNHITTNITWGETEVAFMVQSSFWVNVGASLHLNNNVVVKFESGVTLTHNNNITWGGSGAAFTSYRDDSRKGDTNGNGPSSGANFDWDGIYDNTHPVPGPYYEGPGWPIYFDSH